MIHPCRKVFAMSVAMCMAMSMAMSTTMAHADCGADLNGDTTVDGGDIAMLLSNWGGAGGDISGDGTTDGSDLASLLSAWGDCPALPSEWLLVSALGGSTTSAYDATGVEVKTWTGAASPASLGYLRADGSLVRPVVHSAGVYNGAARGGRIQIFDNSGAIVHDLIVSTSAYQQHHDIRPLANGNILCIVWEGHTQAEGLAAGRTGLTTPIWSESILEIQPTGFSTFNVVWRWNLWDHLVQEANAALANYGIVADHPERLNINAGTVSQGGAAGAGDWIHMNAIDYSPTLDQIVVSSRTLSEMWVIDHSTTTAQAATHAGGTSGKGGDIIYRWGNPTQYGRGSTLDRRFYVVHGVTWIDDGLPGAGNILTFVNGDRAGTANDYSTVMEVTPPRDASGNYVIGSAVPFGPSEPSWSYGSPGQMYGGATQCGAFRTLDNTTLITLTNSNKVFEVNAAGETLWSRTFTGGSIARAPRYRQVGGSWVGP